MLKLVGELWRRKRERGSQKEEDVGFCHPKIQLKSAGNSSREIEMVGDFLKASAPQAPAWPGEGAQACLWNCMGTNLVQAQLWGKENRLRVKLV